MTKEDLLAKLNGIEWIDFEVKDATGGLPKSIWETVCSFSNTAGGTLVIGVKESKTAAGSNFIVSGVPNAEKVEQEVITVLRSRTKFNSPITCIAHKFDIDGNVVLAFDIPLSPHRPVAFKSSGEVFIRTGSGDVLASDLEVDAIARDSAFGTKSEMEVPDSSFADLNLDSLSSYRSFLRDFNDSIYYAGLDDESFCGKLNIVLASGRLTYGSLLMFGKREAVLKAVPNFWIDYMEVPGPSYEDAQKRYSYRMPEQDNIWNAFLLIMHRLRNFVDAPFVEGPQIFGTQDLSQLFCLREGLVNFCAHSDYFAAAHPTIRVFSDKIVMQNPGRFVLDVAEFRNRILSMPRNPSIIKFFRYAKLAENAGYGIDKIMKWQLLSGQNAAFHSDLLVSTVVFPLTVGASVSNGENGENGEKNGENTAQIGEKNGENGENTAQVGEKNGENGEKNGGNPDLALILAAIVENPAITQPQLAVLTGFSLRKVNRVIAALRNSGRIVRVGRTKGGRWQVVE